MPSVTLIIWCNINRRRTALIAKRDGRWLCIYIHAAVSVCDIFVAATVQVKVGTTLVGSTLGGLVHTPWRRHRIKQVFNRA